MSSPRLLLKVLTKRGWVMALATAMAILVGNPASAQFFNFPGFGNFGDPSRPAPPPRRSGGWFGSDFFRPSQQEPQQPRQDFSKAPPPAKRETVAEHNILVLGDSMADWLAYGLEDAYADQPDMGVIRRDKTVSGLIRYQPKGEPSDWAAAAKGILANEKPDAIIVMLGLNDRMSIRESATDKPADKKNDKKDARGKPDSKPADATPGATDAAAKPEDKAGDPELPQDEADSEAPPPSSGKTARTPNGLYEFRDDRWVELYARKIEEFIAVLKSKNVPVLWVGLPAIRGQRGTTDMLFLDSLYRDEAGKAGITYVDIWDGFVDEAGRFLQKGPDFEGQIRQLRTSDGVHFTKAGARKLAHYAEREINRVLAARSGPVTLPSEPGTPDANAAPGQPARPVAGPIIPLVASSISTDQLLGGPGSRPASVDPLAARALVKGEPLAPPAGRADDYSWPRRQVGNEQAKGETPLTSTAPEPNAPAATPAPPPKPAKRAPQHSGTPAPQRPAPAPSSPPSLRDFFGFGSPSQAPAPRGPAPRPPGGMGRSAEGTAYPTR